MKTKIYVQQSDTGSKWLTMEIEDLNGKWLYRSKRLVNDRDLFTRTHIFHYDDHEVDYHKAWKTAHEEMLLEARKERATRPEPKEAWSPI